MPGGGAGRIYHITTRDDWTRQRDAGAYRHPSLDAEGFIHCSTREQLHPTWERIFGRGPGLVALEIDPARLGAPLRYEESEPGEVFPHVYGALNAEAVVAVHELEPGAPAPS